MLDQKRFTKVLTSVSLTCLVASSISVGLVSHAAPGGQQDPLQGSVIKTGDTNPAINPDDLKELEKGTPLEMTVTTSLETGGTTAAGDEFFAKVTRDYAVDGKVVIPRDTLVHGQVIEAQDPKRAMRNGFISTKFDYLITPDGREIPIEADYTNKDSKAKAIAKVVGKSTAYTLGGGVVGAMMVLKYGGLASVVASHGYALAGGAAVGGAIGLTGAMIKKGNNTMITPGAELKVKLQDKLILPTMNLPDESANNIQLEGLKVKVLGMRSSKDPFGEMTEITLTLDMNNHTENTFTFFDIGLEDENGTIHYASPFGDTGLWFQKLS
ncbi:MAG: hypothetical protein K2X66_07240, partial [Cyanobacteria bacterium]|nr:hypothetical protein [Cyanobacteriota bacterium]